MTKISAATNVVSLVGTEEFPVSDGGALSKAALVSDVAEYMDTRLRYGVRAMMSGTQAVTTGTWEPLELDTHTWGPVGDATIHDTVTNNDRFYARDFDGEWAIRANVEWEAVSTGTPYLLSMRVRLNGSTTYGTRDEKGYTSDGTNQRHTFIFDDLSLSADDYLTVEVRHNRGSDMNVDTETYVTFYLLGIAP
jgi:hypothetical protein